MSQFGDGSFEHPRRLARDVTAAFAWAEKEIDELRSEVERLKADKARLDSTHERYAEVFRRIAKAIGIESPIELIAQAKNNEQNYAEILADIIERMKGDK